MYLARFRGMTLIDVLVGSAIALVFFLAVFQLLRASALISTLATETAAATSIANSQMEYIRSLNYDDVGTVGGIPAGVIPQDATTTEDGIDYAVHTFIEYYDDPADGSGTSDSNGITTDYKLVKVSVSFTTTTGTHTVTIDTNVTPIGIETTTGGGTLRIVAVDASGNPVAGATVRIYNPSTVPAVDVSTFTDSLGTALLGGAATSTNYQITVSKSGYSTAQTYDRDTNNQNPNPGHLTVVENQTTSGTFAIDVLSAFTMHVYLPIATSTFSDAFTDGSKLASMTNVTAASGALTLTSDGAGGYLTPGSARSIGVSPALLAHWGAASAMLTLPVGASAVVHVTDGSGTLVPDAALAGNSTGFTSFPVDLSALSTTTYSTLALRVDMTGGTATPSLTNWSLSYATGPTPVPNVDFTLTGAKTIGSTGGGAPIYKTTIATTTDASGSVPLALEWDSYALSFSGYDVVDACPTFPYNVLPNTTTDARLVIASATPNALLVSTTDASGNSLSGASVTLSRTGFSQTVTSSSCGTAYFGDVDAHTDYSLSATSGALNASYTNVPVSGYATYAAILQ
ncbi:MAG TPA: carboxypeptidase-like regulatory domain-containing protein [Candidatus Paceibacterota bacterium]|nr:carboxypeptidase-like regulatory domain-containing protein [Candidatus Paceibacterota bacterium]